MKLVIKILQGPECQIEVHRSDNILKVKKLVEAKDNIPVSHQKLVFQGKTLGDYTTVGECGLKDGSKLFLVRQKGKDIKSAGSSAAAGGGPLVSEPPTGALWDELRRFLLRHFTKQNAELVLQEYRKDFEKTMSSLNLDDIERFATAKLTGGRMEMVDMDTSR